MKTLDWQFTLVSPYAYRQTAVRGRLAPPAQVLRRKALGVAS